MKEANPLRRARRPARALPPLSDAQWRKHRRTVEAQLTLAIAQGQETDVRYTVRGDRTRWLLSRTCRQEQIAEEVYARAAGVPSRGRAVITGGLMGAGKTTVVSQDASLDLSQYLLVSADVVKETMCRCGMMPEVAGLSPLETATLVQRESALISQLVIARAGRDGKNLIRDFSMPSRPAVESRLMAMRDAGYEHIRALFVDAPVEMCVQRADRRHRLGHERYRNGIGWGGRYVPARVIRGKADPVWGSANRRAFEETKHLFDAWCLYDSSGTSPRLVTTSP